MQNKLAKRESPRDSRIRLEAYLNYWLDITAPKQLREKSLERYRGIVENHLIPSRLGQMKIGALGPAVIEQVLVNNSKESARTQQLCLITLRVALAWAVRSKVLDSNPVVGIKPPRFEGAERRVLSLPQAKAFLEAAKGDRLYALYYLALDTGMREGELFALQWENVDLERGVIRVVQTINTATGKMGPPKTAKSRRRIDIGPQTRAVLAAHKERMAREGQRGAFVFPSTRGTALSPPNVRLRSFLPLQLKAEIDPPIRFHDLRHTSATLALEAGAHLKMVSERMGHSSIMVTADLYQHVSETMHLAELANRMDLLLGDKPKGGKRGGQAKSPEKKKARKV